MEKSSFKLENSKKNFFNNFFSGEKLSEYRQKAIRRTFLVLSLLFFINYYFIGVGFHEDFFSQTIPKIYFLFVVSGTILGYNIFNDVITNKFLKYLSYIFFSLLGIVALLPLFIKKEFLLNLFN